MLNYKASEAAKAVSSSNKMTRRDIVEIVRFAAGFILSTAVVAGIPMMLNMF